MPPHVRIRATWLVLICGIVLAFGLSLIRDPLNGDVSYFLYSASQILDGARLYVDIVEPNPPLPYYLPVPIVWIARHLGVSPEGALNVTFYLLTICSLVLSTRFLVRLFPGESAGVGLLATALAYTLFPRSKGMFIERDVLLYAMVLPLAFQLALPSSRFWPSIAVGLLAGVGFAFKPYFMLVWLCLQGAVVMQWGVRGLFRVENLSAVAVATACNIAVLVAFPDYRFVLRMAAAFYTGFDPPFWTILVGYGSGYLLLMAVLFGTRPLPQYLVLRRSLAWLGLGFLLSGLGQRKGFYYHFYPEASVAVLIGCVLLLEIAEKRKYRLAPVAFAAGIVLLVVTVISVARPEPLPKMTGELLPIIHENASGKPVLAFSTSLWAAFPVVPMSGATYSWRFYSLWILPGLYPGAWNPGEKPRYRTARQRGEFERFLFDSLMEDTSRRPPELVIVETTSMKEGLREFDYLEYFLRDDRFALFWRNYELLRDVTNYRVFRRRTRE